MGSPFQLESPLRRGLFSYLLFILAQYLLKKKQKTKKKTIWLWVVINSWLHQNHIKEII